MIINLRGHRKIIALLLVVAVVLLGFALHRWIWRSLYPLPYRDTIFHFAEENRLPPLLVAAVIRVESRFRPQATSPVGARGLMQVMPETGRWAAEQLGLPTFNPDMLYQPETNIRIGAWYLGQLRREFNQDLILALAAYNGGRGNVRDWLSQNPAASYRPKDIPFPETRDYVQRVLQDYLRYRRIYPHLEPELGQGSISNDAPNGS